MLVYACVGKFIVCMGKMCVFSVFAYHCICISLCVGGMSVANVLCVCVCVCVCLCVSVLFLYMVCACVCALDVCAYVCIVSVCC